MTWRDGGGWQGRIAISGALAVLTSLTLSTLAGKVNRKFLLLGMTVLMAVSGLIIALASSHLMYMVGRAMIGVAIGGFWSMSAATAIRLVPQHQVTRALAIFNAGNALATAVAAPLGSYLGATVGWRGAFLCWSPSRLSPLSGSVSACPAWVRIKDTRHVALYSIYLAAALLRLACWLVACFLWGSLRYLPMCARFWRR